MRSPLNKARKTTEISLEVPQTMPVMNPEFMRILNQAESLDQTETKNDYMYGLAQAWKAQEEAARAKENAETEAQFNKACDEAIRAREKEEFFLRLLDKYKYTPRMSEADYSTAVEAVGTVIKKAAAEIRSRGHQLMNELIKMRKDYLQLMKDADKVLTALDESSNVLQSKYRYSVTEWTSGEQILKEDPNEWLKHTTRYSQGKAAELIMKDPDSSSIYDPWDKIICAAWKAAESVSE